ncbi:ataxin-10 [Thalassophryne amazonica]|uniref:ataxin-10 n=1 Tax=Thalassophryne amazonica TaxID=390379 RepID=UPI001470D280|nr:ataxin-10 [Thalassophryne amazonica]
MAASFRSWMNVSSAFSCILNEKLCRRHLEIVETLTTVLRDTEYREAVQEEIFSSLLTVLSRLCEELQGASRDDQDQRGFTLQVTAECFRALRNSCVQCTRNQCMLRNLGFIDVSFKLLISLQNLTLESPDGIFEPLRCGIQFLGNLSVGNQRCKDDIWQLIFPKFLLQLLHVNDDKTVSYASMVLHTCLDEAKVEKLADSHHIQLALRVMELCRVQPDLEWTIIIATHHFLKSPVLVKSMYAGMSDFDRVTLLELLLAQLKAEESKDSCIPPDVAHFVACCFQKCCGDVLMLTTRSASSDEVMEEARIVTVLLEVLCEMTSDRTEFMFLQDHPDLLLTTIELLQQVHAMGKASSNIFSATWNFSSLSIDGDFSPDCPVVNFKARLIRLIGNLCHSNTNNQNKVRELDGIPLILDNCNIDSNNPFISQWAIFAIRNLLEHNKQNQELVGSLERSGTVDYSALRDLGFEIEERDGSFLLKPVRKDG